MAKYRYFFSYTTGLASGGIGFGNYTADLDHPIRGWDDLQWIAEAIRVRHPGNTAVTIMSWQRFEED